MTTKLSGQVRSFSKTFGVEMPDKPGAAPMETLKLRLKLNGEEFCEALDACGFDSSEVWHAIMATLNSGGTGVVDFVNLMKELSDIDFVTEGFRLVCGVDGEPVADETFASNMTKLGDDGKPVYREDGKVTKGPNYRPADIESVLRKQGWTP